MPIYEFVCEACGERFDALVELGTETLDCDLCGTGGSKRVLSAQAPPMRLVKTPRDARKQERSNAALRRKAKADFKRKRTQVQAARDRARGGEGRT